MNNPLISIITCTKNSQKYLPECLKSVKIQKFRNFEHIFIDGESTDNTNRIIADYIDKNRNIRTKVIKSPPKGISNAMNIGIKSARGDIIHILHSDDYYYNEKALGKVSKYFKDCPNITWLIGNRVISAKGKILKIKFNNIFNDYGSAILNVFNWIPHASTFMKKSIFKKYGYFDESLKIAMDYGYWMKIMDKEPYLLVNEDLTVFRRHKGSNSLKINNMIPLISDYFKLHKNIKKAFLIRELKKFIKNS